MKIKLAHKFEDIISVDNLILAWQEFIKDKRNRKDTQEFMLNLMDNIIDLHWDLQNFRYEHGDYQAFKINDPKPRNIHKAVVRDRLLHHAINRVLYPFFDRTFIADSYSCRMNKAGLKAINCFKSFVYKVSENRKKTVWVLKCDIRKFFDSINHEILIGILKDRISDENIIWLLEKVIFSFSKTSGMGLPLGNLTSQLFVNIYMNEFDQYIKHKLKAKYYVRYADDFVVLSQDKSWLEELIFKIGDFLQEKLQLELHLDKVYIKTLFSGVDFLGWVHFPNHRILRTVTKKRMFRKLLMGRETETLASYLGLLSHGNTVKIRVKLNS